MLLFLFIVFFIDVPRIAVMLFYILIFVIFNSCFLSLQFSFSSPGVRILASLVIIFIRKTVFLKTVYWWKSKVFKLYNFFQLLSPIKFRLSRTSTTSSSPSTTPHPPKPSHASTEGAIQLELDSSPVYIKETQQVSVRPALETKTNSLGVEKSSPGIGLVSFFLSREGQ